MEMDAIDSWKGKVHVFKLLLRENMEKSSFCIFEQFYAELLCMCFNYLWLCKGLEVKGNGVGICRRLRRYGEDLRIP